MKTKAEFNYVLRYTDGSTETKKNGIRIITKKDGSIFTDALGRTEFDYVLRYTDGSTMTEKNGNRIITEKGGNLKVKIKQLLTRMRFYSMMIISKLKIDTN